MFHYRRKSGSQHPKIYFHLILTAEALTQTGRQGMQTSRYIGFVTIIFMSIIVIIHNTILPDQIIEHSCDLVLKLYQLLAVGKFEPHSKELRI